MTTFAMDIDFDTPQRVHPAVMNPDQLAAAGLRWMTKEEHMAACAVRDNFADTESAARSEVAQLPIARLRLESALATLEQLTHELRTRRRKMTTADGIEFELASPFFVDDAGRDEDHWRAQAAEATAEIAKLGKAGAPTDEVVLHHVADLRLRAASALNIADELAFNTVMLRRCVEEARQNVKHFATALADIQARTVAFQ